HRPTRAEALATMRRALAGVVVEGGHTTIPLLADIFRHPAFLAGQGGTTFIERAFSKPGGRRHAGGGGGAGIRLPLGHPERNRPMSAGLLAAAARQNAGGAPDQWLSNPRLAVR